MAGVEGGNLFSHEGQTDVCQNKCTVDKNWDFWNNILWTDECNDELTVHQNRGRVWHKTKWGVLIFFSRGCTT